MPRLPALHRHAMLCDFGSGEDVLQAGRTSLMHDETSRKARKERLLDSSFGIGAQNRLGFVHD